MKRLISKGDIYKATGIIRIDDLNDVGYLSAGDQGVFLFRSVSIVYSIKGQISSIVRDGVNTKITFVNTCLNETLDIYSGTSVEGATVTWSALDNCWTVK